MTTLIQPAQPRRRQLGKKPAKPRKAAAPRGPLTLPASVILYGQPYTLSANVEIFGGQAEGIQTIQTFEGDPARIRTELRDNLIAEDIRFRFDDSIPGKIEIYRDYQADGTPATTDSLVVECWDLDWESVLIPAAYAPCFRSTADNKVDMGVINTAAYIDSYDPDLMPNWQSIDFNAKYGSNLANKYRDKRALGETTYELFHPILVQRITQATSGQRQASTVGINRVWRVNPNSRLNKLGDLSQWVFRKLPPNKTLYKGKVGIEQRYVGAESWDPDFYPPMQA